MLNNALVNALVPAFPREETPASVSARIRARLIAAGCDFRANANIAAFIGAGEFDGLRAEVENHVRDLLRALVIDVDHDHNTRETARRVAGMFLDEVFAGRYRPAPEVTAFPNVARADELLMVGPITVRSACSHHLTPIMGRVWIGVLPNAASELIGLSKYARLCDWVMRRPQIQEEAVIMLADELERRVRPDGLAIVMEADHFCLHWRGVKDGNAAMTSTVMRGAFRDNAALRREFLSLRARRND